MRTVVWRRLALLAVCGIFSTTAAPAAEDGELRTTLEDQQSVAVTIYNEDLALVKDVRQVTLGAGENRLAFREVSARMRPETAQLRSLTHPQGFAVEEQNFDFDLLSPQKLLEKFVGRKVLVVKTNPATGAETEVEAEVLAAAEGVVLKVGDRIETGMPGRLAYPEVPANLRDRPTLAIQLRSGTDKPQRLELSYLTGGLSWKADYVAELAADDSRMDLSGWVTLTNRSGAPYRQARLQLVAGDVHQVAPEDFRVRTMAAPAVAMEARPKMAEEGLFEYHLYTLERPASIAENQTKQIALLTAAGVPVRKEFVLHGNDYYYTSSVGELGQKLKAGVFVEFENRQQAGLGLALPKGIVRVYKRDSAGAAQFIGEDRIDHTPRNEKIRLRLGDAFDVTADKKQTDFKKLSGTGRYNYLFESAYQIVLKNAKEEAVTVKVLEPMPGDWEVVQESHPHRKETAGTAVWEVPVPAGTEVSLTYRVRIKY